MKRKYNAKNLFVGRIMIATADFDYPTDYKTEIKYIFEGKSIEDAFFKEILTGKKMETEINTHGDGYVCKIFGRPYIIELEKYTDFFPEEDDAIVYAQDILYKINDINCKSMEQKLTK